MISKYDPYYAMKLIEEKLGINMDEAFVNTTGDPVLDACLVSGMTKDGIPVSKVLDVFEDNVNIDNGMNDRNIQAVINWYNREKKRVPKDWMRKFLGDEEYEELSRLRKESRKFNSKPWLLESLRK